MVVLSVYYPKRPIYRTYICVNLYTERILCLPISTWWQWKLDTSKCRVINFSKCLPRVSLGTRQFISTAPIIAHGQLWPSNPSLISSKMPEMTGNTSHQQTYVVHLKFEWCYTWRIKRYGAAIAKRVSALDWLSLRCAAIIMLHVSSPGLCP